MASAVGVALAVIPPLTQLTHLLLTERRWWSDLLADDSYYYLGPARSIVQGDGSTFTGLVTTNGYHPLWLVVLLPAVALTGGEANPLIFAVLLVQGVLWAASVREALRIGRLVGCWECAAGGLAAYGVLGVLTGRLAFSGMETGILLLLLLWLSRLIIEAPDRADAHHDLRLGVVMALVCLARLDAIFVVVAVCGYLVLSHDRGAAMPTRIRRLLRLAGPSAIALVTYMALNVGLFETPVPVSGRAKALGAPFFNTEPFVGFVRAGELDGRPLWFGLATVVGVVVGFASTQRRGGRLQRVGGLALALLGAQGLLLTYLTFGTSYPAFYWYHYVVAVMAFCATLALLRWGLDTWGPAVAHAALGLAAVFLVAQAVVTFRPEPVAYEGSRRGAEFVQANLRDDAVFAMGDRGGIFGFLAERPLLQLEGLMADLAYLRDLDRGRVIERMASEGVDYYVHYGRPGQPVAVHGRACHRFVEPAQSGGPTFGITVCQEDLVYEVGSPDDRFTIWRFRPELNVA